MPASVTVRPTLFRSFCSFSRHRPRVVPPPLSLSPLDPGAHSWRSYGIAQFLDRLIVGGLFALAISLSPADATPPTLAEDAAPALSPQERAAQAPYGAKEQGRASQAQLRVTSPGEATSGTLLLKTTTPGEYLEAPRVATDVQITISGPFARTRVTQRFENPTRGWVEGVYAFPLPDMSAVDTLRLQIGDRFIEGEIEEKKKAKAIYNAAKAAGKKASLLEQQRANVFTNAVANIGPYETVVVQIEYQEAVRVDGDDFSLRFPMVVAPRYTPAPLVQNVVFNGGDGWGRIDATADNNIFTTPYLTPEASAEAEGPINPVTLSVDLDAGFPLADISSSYHQIVIDQNGDRKARLRLVDEAVPADRDFELRWRPSDVAAASAGLFVESVGAEEYYIAMVTPPTVDSAAPPSKREAIFVLDTSGSMGGASIRQAKESLKLALERLKPTDSFNIVQFNSSMEQLFPAARQAHPHTVAVALSYLDRLEAGGGTNMLPALNAALSMGGLNDGRVRQVVFLTDGAIGNEDQLFAAIAQGLGAARVFTVGIGSAPNSFFMSRAAELGRGTFTHIGDLSEVKARMGVLFEKLETPLVTDLAIEWPSGLVIDAWPTRLPDVYRGEPVVVTAKLAGAPGNGVATITGLIGEQPWQAKLPLAQATRRNGASKLWARRKIAALELEIARGAARTDIEPVMLQTALDHHLISRLTSLVAVDQQPTPETVRPANVQLDSKNVPLSLPAGWEFDAVFPETNGQAIPRRERKASLSPQMGDERAFADLAFEEQDPSSESAAAPVQAKSGIALPQGALLSDVKITRGLLWIAMGLFLFSLVSGALPQRAVTPRVLFPTWGKRS